MTILGDPYWPWGTGLGSPCATPGLLQMMIWGATGLLPPVLPTKKYTRNTSTATLIWNASTATLIWNASTATLIWNASTVKLIGNISIVTLIGNKSSAILIGNASTVYACV